MYWQRRWAALPAVFWSANTKSECVVIPDTLMQGDERELVPLLKLLGAPRELNLHHSALLP
jgi:hypothetical protein